MTLTQEERAALVEALEKGIEDTDTKEHGLPYWAVDVRNYDEDFGYSWDLSRAGRIVAELCRELSEWEYGQKEHCVKKCMNYRGALADADIAIGKMQEMAVQKENWRPLSECGELDGRREYVVMSISDVWPSRGFARGRYIKEENRDAAGATTHILHICDRPVMVPED